MHQGCKARGKGSDASAHEPRAQLCVEDPRGHGGPGGPPPPIPTYALPPLICSVPLQTRITRLRMGRAARTSTQVRSSVALFWACSRHCFGRRVRRLPHTSQKESWSGRFPVFTTNTSDITIAVSFPRRRRVHLGWGAGEVATLRWALNIQSFIPAQTTSTSRMGSLRRSARSSARRAPGVLSSRGATARQQGMG